VSKEQRLRKIIVSRKRKIKYYRKRKLPSLRILNKQLFLSTFKIRNLRPAARRIKTLDRHRVRYSQFQRFARGFLSQVDTTLTLINIAPTTKASRVMAKMGLYKCNGVIQRGSKHRLKPDDVVTFHPNKIANAREYLTPAKKPFTKRRQDNITTAGISKNIVYHHKTLTGFYERFPRINDIPNNNRISTKLLPLFFHDAGRTRVTG